MRSMLAGLAGLALALACASGAACAQAPTPAAPPTASVAPKIIGSGALRCLGGAEQGGAIFCRVKPGKIVTLDGKPIAKADDKGLAIIGLTRAQRSPAVISIGAPPAEGLIAQPEPLAPLLTIPVAKRHDDVGSLEMECEKIAPTTPENQKKAADSLVKKNKALEAFSNPMAPLALQKPVEATEQQYSASSFGRTRTYIPKTADCTSTVNVHNGTDIAVPQGTEIRAPMAGTVILADPDLYFEGGCIFLDLGRGLVSVTMHMSRIDVKPGQVVKQGELLGLSGATGRVTGPHVHWAIKFRNVFEKDRGGDIWLDPMILLKMNSAKLMAD